MSLFNDDEIAAVLERLRDVPDVYELEGRRLVRCVNGVIEPIDATELQALLGQREGAQQ